MQGIMDINFVVMPKRDHIFSYNIDFPHFHILPNIYSPSSKNMCASETGANYNELCSAVSRCNSGCDSMRKVVSHVFGRNKSCTMQIPEACTISWCRQHYQRFRYRSKENWINIQIDIIRRQLDRIEEWGKVRSWTIDWGKSEKEAINAENTIIAQRDSDTSHHGNVVGFTAINQINPANATEEPFDENRVPTGSARLRLPHLGTGKTLAQVRATVDSVESWATTPNGYGKEFPQIEFLPDIDKQLYPPVRARKEDRRKKVLTPTAMESSSSPTVVSASTSSAENSSKSTGKSLTRGVKRSASNAFEDEATDETADQYATTKTNPSAKRRQCQASRPTATSKAAKGRKGTKNS